MQLLGGKSVYFWCCWGLLSWSSNVWQSEGWVSAARCATLSCLLVVKRRGSALLLLIPDYCSPPQLAYMAPQRADSRLWTRDQTSRFITMIQARPCIWNAKCTEYKKKRARSSYASRLSDCEIPTERINRLWAKLGRAREKSPSGIAPAFTQRFWQGQKVRKKWILV